MHIFPTFLRESLKSSCDFNQVQDVNPIWISCKTTTNGGSLGSRIDEERSETRNVMWIAEFSESSNLWTHLALSNHYREYACLSVAKLSTPPHALLRVGSLGLDHDLCSNALAELLDWNTTSWIYILAAWPVVVSTQMHSMGTRENGMSFPNVLHFATSINLELLVHSDLKSGRITRWT